MYDFPTKITENIKEYILGGNSRFCVKQAGAVDYSRWFRVVAGRGGVFFVYVVEDKKDKYAGYFYKNDLGALKSLQVKDKKAEVGMELAMPLIRVLNRLENFGVLWDEVQVISDGKCSVCGRRITDDDSLNYGIGPVCRKKLRMA